MIQSSTSTKQMARSMLIIPAIETSRESSSSVNSTTSVICSKEAQHRSLSPSRQDEDRRPPKKVDFSRKVRVKLVSSRDRFSEKERSSMWYSSEEYTAIRQSAVKTVTKMAKNKAVDLDPSDCSRGLEGKTPKQDELRQERRRIIMWSVLAEQQEKHLDDYETSSRAISAAYSVCNRSCAYEAERRGELDAIEAWGIDMS